MKSVKLIFKFILIALISSSCAKKDPGTSTGNPMVELTMTSSNNVATVAKSFLHLLINSLIPPTFAKLPPNSMVDSQGNNVTISKFWISLGEMEFKLEETASSEESAEVSFTGPYSIDMLSDTISPLATSAISTNQFRRLKYKLKKFTSVPNNAPADVLNNAIYISGTVNGNPFIYTTSSEVENSIAGPSAVQAPDQSRILVQLQLANLIKKINLSGINSPTTTNINEANRLSGSTVCPSVDTSLTDVYTCFLKGFESESNIGRDDNKDGELNSSESTVK